MFLPNNWERMLLLKGWFAIHKKRKNLNKLFLLWDIAMLKQGKISLGTSIRLSGVMIMSLALPFMIEQAPPTPAFYGFALGALLLTIGSRIP